MMQTTWLEQASNGFYFLVELQKWLPVKPEYQVLYTSTDLTEHAPITSRAPSEAEAGGLLSLQPGNQPGQNKLIKK